MAANETGFKPMLPSTNVSHPIREIARFGEVSVLVGEGDEHVLQRDANIIRLDGRGPFRVVVQKGRSFQRANPHIPVLVDRGRYLIVAYSRELDVQHEGVHFSMALADAESVGFREERAVPVPRNPAVTAALQRISAAALKSKVETLAALHTRHARLPAFEPALAISKEWLETASCEVERVELPMPGGRTANLIGHRLGQAADRKLFVVGAHLDSINHEDGPDAAAPGADDNASGCATIGAMAQAIADESLQHDVQFVLFGGEEEGLFGSKHFVSRMSAADRKRLAGAINIDMAASRNTPDRAVLLEGAPVSRHVIDGLVRAAATYTSLLTQVSLQPFSSDHVPFIEQGLAAVLTIEGTDSAFEHEHTARDTPDRLDFELHREITSMNLAWLLEQTL